MSQLPRDPVIEEIREVRHRILERFNHDPKRLLEYYMRLQEAHRDRFIEACKQTTHTGEGEPSSPKGKAIAETLFCADWGKRPDKRAVRLARVSERTVERVAHPSWSLIEILSHAERERERGPVLVAVDTVLGVPCSYMDRALRSVPEWREATGYLDWLTLLEDEDPLFSDLSSAVAWSPRVPFFQVPHGKGAFQRFRERVGMEHLYRRIDRLVHAKPVFAACGIPGTVGSGSRVLWKELASLLREPRSFRVWPFEGDNLEKLLTQAGVVLAEVYPRVTYSMALAESLPTKPRPLAKTKQPIRRDVLKRLASASWVKEYGVALSDLGAAENSEDDFDALLTAAALLRCVIMDEPLCDPMLVDPLEGGILGLVSASAEPGRPR